MSLCLQAVGLICSHICKICSCILHLGRASQPLNQHLELQNLGLIPAEPEQRMALQAGSKALAFLWEHFSWGCTRAASAQDLDVQRSKGQDRTFPWWLVAHTRPCFKNLLKMHHHHLFGVFLAKEESPLCPLHTTRQDFPICRSRATQIHLHSLD